MQTIRCVLLPSAFADEFYVKIVVVQQVGWDQVFVVYCSLSVIIIVLFLSYKNRRFTKEPTPVIGYQKRKVQLVANFRNSDTGGPYATVRHSQFHSCRSPL